MSDERKESAENEQILEQNEIAGTNEKEAQAPQPEDIPETTETILEQETAEESTEKEENISILKENPADETAVENIASQAAETTETAAEGPQPTNEPEEEEEAEDEADSETEGETDASDKDFSKLSETELISELETLLKNKPIQKIKAEVEEIRSEFTAKNNEAFEKKKEQFLADGGNIIDFHYSSPLKKQFDSLYSDFKAKRNAHYKNLKKDLETNLDKRWALIEELKGLLNTEENINSTYKHFREIQERWHGAGAIPRDKYNTVWNTYHHHVENFYDFLHLNREFRDLDFKHNLEEKLKIIIRAEELAADEDINKAFRELQLLHKRWKEDLGPVAKEYRDEVWDKFSAATKTIHDRRQVQLQEMEKEFEANYELKRESISEMEALANPSNPTHQTWQNGIKKLQELRDAFFAIGPVPRAKNKEIWKAFKMATAAFNHNKNEFYKSQKKEQFVNLDRKLELIKIANENKDGEDFDAITPLMKKIQNEWKAIGHVPRKDSDKVWKQFRNACNHYFDRLHAQKNEENKEEIVHYAAKKELLDSLTDFELSGNHKEDFGTIKQKIATWKELGKVPQSKRHIEQKFNKTLDRLFEKMDMGKKEKELLKFETKLNTLVTEDDDRKLQNEHFFISKKIDETRDEIRQLENNIGFFQHVDSNNPLVREVHKNIARHKEQLEVWKAKLSKIKSVRED